MWSDGTVQWDEGAGATVPSAAAAAAAASADGGGGGGGDDDDDDEDDAVGVFAPRNSLHLRRLLRESMTAFRIHKTHPTKCCLLLLTTSTRRPRLCYYQQSPEATASVTR